MSCNTYILFNYLSKQLTESLIVYSPSSASAPFVPRLLRRRGVGIFVLVRALSKISARGLGLGIFVGSTFLVAWKCTERRDL